MNKNQLTTMYYNNELVGKKVRLKDNDRGETAKQALGIDTGVISEVYNFNKEDIPKFKYDDGKNINIAARVTLDNNQGSVLVDIEYLELID